jgi:hypothetical protein
MCSTAFKLVSLLATLAVLSSVRTAQPAPTDTQEVIIADEVKIAFYEAAPRSLLESMQRAKDETCEAFGRSSTPSKSETQQPLVTWLCDGTPLRYFRAVNLLGSKYRSGLVCRMDSVTPNLRYYTVDMFSNNAGCLGVSYIEETKRNEIEVG